MKVVLWGDSRHRLFVSAMERIIRMDTIELAGVVVPPVNKLRSGWQRPVLSWKDWARRASRRLIMMLHRKRDSIASRWEDVEQVLSAKGVSLLAPSAKQLREAEYVDALNKFEADLFLFIVYTEYVPEEVFGLARQAINIHPSLLPAYRGSYPLVWALWHGEDVVGATAFKMHRDLDAGDIVAQRNVITTGRSFHAIYDDIERQVVALAEEVLCKAKAGMVSAHPQDIALASMFKSPKESDFLADFVNWTGLRFVRMDEISKGALWTMFGSRRLALSEISQVQVFADKPGRIVDISPEGVVVQVADGAILIRRIESGAIFSTHAQKVAEAIGLQAGMMFHEDVRQACTNKPEAINERE